MEGLTRSKFATIHAPEFMEKSGYDFTLTGATDGNGAYGVKLVNKFYNGNVGSDILLNLIARTHKS